MSKPKTTTSSAPSKPQASKVKGSTKAVIGPGASKTKMASAAGSKASAKPKVRGRTPPAAAHTSRPAKVEVTVDRALKEKWTSLLDRLLDAKREGAGAFDEQWEAIGAIVEHDPPLYLAGGFSTIRDFLDKHVGEDERTARRFIRVAKYASPVEEAKFGISKLDRAISYVEAKTGGPVKERLPVAFDKLKVPVEAGGKTSLVPLEKARVEDIEAATRKLRRADEKDAPVKSSPVVKAVTAQLKSRALRGVSVRVTAGKLFLGAIPIESLGELSAALLRIQIPATDHA